MGDQVKRQESEIYQCYFAPDGSIWESKEAYDSYIDELLSVTDQESEETKKEELEYFVDPNGNVWPSEQVYKEYLPYLHLESEPINSEEIEEMEYEDLGEEDDLHLREGHWPSFKAFETYISEWEGTEEEDSLETCDDLFGAIEYYLDRTNDRNWLSQMFATKKSETVLRYVLRVLPVLKDRIQDEKLISDEERQALQEMNEKLSKENEGLQKAKHALSDKNKLLFNGIKKLQSENTALQTELQRLRAEIEGYTADFQAVTQKLQSENEMLTAENIKFQSRNQELLTEKCNLAEKIRELETIIKQMQQSRPVQVMTFFALNDEEKASLLEQHP